MTSGPLAPMARAMGYVDYSRLPVGISFCGEEHPADDVRFLADLTWHDDAGERHLDHVIFDEIIAMIAGARRLIVLDLFLFNDLLLREQAPVRPLARELTNALVNKRRHFPDVPIIFITDPINTAWGGLRSGYLEELEAAGVTLVSTALNALRDSSPVYTFLWRALIRPFGNRVGGVIPNPFGDGTITLRSLLNIPNMKANHRKTVLADAGATWRGLVTSLNPHDASFAHRNVAIRFDGPAVADLYLTERAVMAFSGAPLPEITIDPPQPLHGDARVQIRTEGKIREAVLQTLHEAGPGSHLRLILFYLSEREVVHALAAAAQRGAQVQIILDPSKDAFGWQKSGIPNRPVAQYLQRRGVSVRWAATRGEQCHTKMMLVDQNGGDSLLLCGSANFTRRNLNDFNLESDVCVRGAASADVMASARRHFDDLWDNRDGRPFTVEYARYEDRRWTQHVLYWLMETTGISTF